MAVAKRHSEYRQSGQASSTVTTGPEEILRRVERDITQTLEDASAEYKNRPNNAPLPLPRLQRLVFDDDLVESDESPVSVIEALKEEDNLFIKVARSYPEKTIAWSIAQSLLRQEINGKQLLPVVVEGNKFSPPSHTLKRVSGLDISSEDILRNFRPVIVISDPDFDSRTKLAFLISELKTASQQASIVVVTKAETPVDSIDQTKAQLGLTDYFTTSVPFGEIAAYLEEAFEMAPGEADSVAARLEDTFSRFRLNTHPAYFIGIEESTLTALINANQRAELIELAVSGVLSFVVAADKSPVKLSRTTREEFLRELAYEIRVEKRRFCKSELAAFAEEYAAQKALELEPLSFLKGFFDIGLLTDCTGSVTFSLPFVEAFLLSDKLKHNAFDAKRYFNPREDEFDTYAFDLYCERGADSDVVEQILSFADDALRECDDEKNVFVAKSVRPVALSTAATLVDVMTKMGDAVEKIASEPSSEHVRLEKQRLIDARDAVRQRLGDKRKQDRSSLAPERRQQFERLDRLSRAGSLLATLLGSGAERLSGNIKAKAAKLLMKSSERFLHYWTKNRMEFDFVSLRNELLTDESVDELIEQFELFADDREKIRSSLSVFITDQELKALSGPLATILHRLAHLAGVRSLKPILDGLRTEDEMQEVLLGAWYMDVEAESGKRVLKAALRKYRGADLLRFVLANHLMWRVFWHHWQLSSRNIFIETAKATLRPLGLLTAKDHEKKMLAGHRSEAD